MVDAEQSCYIDSEIMVQWKVLACVVVWHCSRAGAFEEK